MPGARHDQQPAAGLDLEAAVPVVLEFGPEDEPPPVLHKRDVVLEERAEEVGAPAGRLHPQVGDAYRQEFDKGSTEDMAEVLSLNESVSVRAGAYKDALKTKEWTPLEPDVVEYKYYAKGVGLALESVARGGEGRLELVRVTKSE